MRRMGYDRCKSAEPMDRLDVGSEVWREVPEGREAGDQVFGRERCTSPVVDVHPI